MLISVLLCHFLIFKCRYSDTCVVLLEYYLEYFFLGWFMSVCVLIYLQASLLCLASEWYNFSIVNNLFLNDILARYRIFELYFLSVFCQCCILSISRCCWCQSDFSPFMNNFFNSDTCYSSFLCLKFVTFTKICQGIFPSSLPFSVPPSLPPSLPPFFPYFLNQWTLLIVSLNFSYSRESSFFYF